MRLSAGLNITRPPGTLSKGRQPGTAFPPMTVTHFCAVNGQDARPAH
jgi:hypothetical protein